MSYLVIPSLRVAEANLINTNFLVGGVPVMPGVMLGHALGRAIGNQALGVAYVHHDLVPNGERQFGVLYPQQRRSATYVFERGKSSDYASSAHGPTLSLQPVATGSVRASLIIEFEHPVSSTDDVAAFLSTARLAGGRIEGHGAIGVHEDAGDAMATIRTGYAVMDRRDLMPLPDSADPLQALIDRLGRRSASPDNSWLSATHLGYAPITPIQARDGAREGYLHAYAEPLVGLVQFRSLRGITAPKTTCFWRPGWTEEGVFLLRQTP
jgi:CRISPR-associated protein Csy2